jgi:hypothetical protein
MDTDANKLAPMSYPQCVLGYGDIYQELPTETPKNPIRPHIRLALSALLQDPEVSSQCLNQCKVNLVTKS